MRSCSGYTFRFSSTAARLLMRQLDALAQASSPTSAGAVAAHKRARRNLTRFYDSRTGALFKAGWMAYTSPGKTDAIYSLGRFRRSGVAYQSRQLWFGTAPADASPQAAFAAITPLPGKIRHLLTQPLALSPCLSTDARRWYWRLSPVASPEIEVALELGHLDTDGQRREFAELTLSSSEADAGPALLALAQQLQQTTALFLLQEPAVHTALRSRFDKPSQPVKYAVPKAHRPKRKTERCFAGLTAIVEHWLSNQIGACEHSDIEYVHQLRVALRRLNAAGKLFAPWLDPAWQDRLAPELRWLRGLLGTVRDWDIFIANTLPALCSATPHPSETEHELTPARHLHQQARTALQAALVSPRYAALVLNVVQSLNETLQRHADHGRPRGLRKHAKKWLRKNHLSPASTSSFNTLPPAKQHRIRLRAKRMRYSIELLAPLLASKSGKSAARSYAAILDTLGMANDAAVAAQLIEKLTLSAGTRAFIAAWLAARRQNCIVTVEQQLPNLRRPALR
jgi:CHAD domain-containing protein